MSCVFYYTLTLHKPVLWIREIFFSDPDMRIRNPELQIRIQEAISNGSGWIRNPVGHFSGHGKNILSDRYRW
jgi:hypothetical protein